MSVKCRVIKGGLCEITYAYGIDGHLGIDLVNKGYTLGGITAHSDGKVCYVQSGYGNAKGSNGMASYGNMVKIDHGNGNYTWYAHLASIAVSNGQEVKKGQDIGYMGDSGNAYGGHLHFEVHIGNQRVNPIDYLDKDLVESITPTVARDENKDQLQVNKIDLRVRKAPATNQPILGFAKENGIYNYYETKEQGGYVWYRIADGQWLANSADWCTIMPKKDDKTTIENLKKEVEQLKKEKQELLDKNKLLEEENKNLKEGLQNYVLFIAPKDGLYHINLKKNETILYEVEKDLK